MTPRSKPARERILAAGRRVFADNGFERATVRIIAAQAGVMPSMIIRYYGSKEGLFAAAIDFDLRLPDLAGLSADQAGALLVRHFLGRWSDPEHGEDLAILMRASLSHDVARARMQTIFETQLVTALVPICGDRSTLCAVLVASQMLGLAYTRFVVQLPATVAMQPDVLALAVCRTIAAYLSFDSDGHAVGG